MGGKERAGRGHCSPGSGHRGAAARPLDDGALTRWGTRTPARGLATAPGLATPLFRPLARSVTAAAALRKEERAQTGEERESRRENDLGFRMEAGVDVFHSPEDAAQPFDWIQRR